MSHWLSLSGISSSQKLPSGGNNQQEFKWRDSSEYINGVAFYTSLRARLWSITPFMFHHCFTPFSLFHISNLAQLPDRRVKKKKIPLTPVERGELEILLAISSATDVCYNLASLS